MAGDAPGCAAWGKKYDETSLMVLQTCANMADALTNFGNVLYAAGYNWGISNDCNPAPSMPSYTQMSESKLQFPSSVATAGLGAEHTGGVGEFFSLLTDKITAEFGKLPNGDTSKLEKAVQVWQGFAKNDTLTKLPTKVGEISSMFNGMDHPKNQDMIQQHLSTISKASGAVLAGGLTMASPVSDFNVGMGEVNKEISAAWTTFGEVLAGIAVGAAIGALVTFGASIAGAAVVAATASVKAMDVIRLAYTGSKLYKLLGMGAAVGGTVGGVATAGAVGCFDSVPNMTEVSLALAEIIAMRVYVDTDDAAPADRPKKVPASGSGKEKADDVPSWAKGRAPYVGESGKAYARRLMDEKYGPGNWSDTGPRSEFNKIKKYGDRAWQNPN
ncbi:hypothetical protein ACFXK0_28925 [Nocardia sp. NPDC059177]|uniref:hypothetical protein n=1 Tax=Nocardia sp. NPDC059177 TaxID=3346759 RepID=UPI0036908132